MLLGPSGDQTVSVASQLRLPAQDEAARLYGFDVTHGGILKNPEVAALLQQLLESVLDFKPAETMPVLQFSTIDIESRDGRSIPKASRP
jgi:hypothetical protein